MPPSNAMLRKENVRNQLMEVELQLKALQQRFLAIKEGAEESVSSARQRSKERKLAELRKELGLG